MGDRKTLFVYGSPRSGTTWIQLLLDQHAAVVTAPETQIFGFYLSGFRRQWREELDGAQQNRQGGGGLSQLLSEDEFHELCRLNAEYVLDRIAARDPSATLVVEKSPTHAAHARFIQRLFPDAYFLHVIRDPRDTVASLLAAGRSWGRHWAPAHPADAAGFWRRYVEKGRELRGTGARYRELRYEDLSSDTAGNLAGVLDWLGLEAAPAEIDEFVEACGLDQMRRKGAGSGSSMPLPGRKVPSGFFRKGQVGGWASDLDPGDARIVERVAGPLMEELGYAPAFTPRPGTRLRIRLHRGVARVREGLDWQLQRLLRHI